MDVVLDVHVTLTEIRISGQQYQNRTEIRAQLFLSLCLSLSLSVSLSLILTVHYLAVVPGLGEFTLTAILLVVAVGVVTHPVVLHALIALGVLGRRDHLPCKHVSSMLIFVLSLFYFFIFYF